MSHLLSLPAMHRDGPGSLDVVFGPDGDFEGAPRWDPPVFWLNQYIRWGWLRSQASFEHLILPDLALDLRIPSVAARLAGLCARALGQSQPRGWGVEDANPEWCFQSVWGTRAYNWRLNGAPYGAGLPVLPKGLLTPEAFLASLTLSLAPRIAALGGPRV